MSGSPFTDYDKENMTLTEDSPCEDNGLHPNISVTHVLRQDDSLHLQPYYPQDSELRDFRSHDLGDSGINVPRSSIQPHGSLNERLETSNIRLFE